MDLQNTQSSIASTITYNIKIVTDDVEKSLELLDKVLSEFEDPDSLPSIIDPHSPSQGNQSEDDGYMSMNGRRISPNNTNTHRNDFADRVIRKEKLVKGDVNLRNITISQTTLPKTRTSTILSSRYASLPCASPSRIDTSNEVSAIRNDEKRKGLGIGISEVHNAVLKGVARSIPEPIVNEHPVTIYPGRFSPIRKNAIGNRCINSNILEKSYPDSINSKQILNNDNNDDNFWPKNNDVLRSSIPKAITYKTIYGVEIPTEVMHNAGENTCPTLKQIQINSAGQINLNIHHQYHHHHNRSSESDEFSDDSLEGLSLPQLLPPTTVTPPPSLSAPVTPFKRGCVAWEIRLDDVDDVNAQDHKYLQKSELLKQDIGKRQSRRLSGSQTCSTTPPGNISASNDKSTPTNCSNPFLHENFASSTEDEATSIYSDSDGIIQYPDNIQKNSGTYVIRKGCKDRRRLSELDQTIKSLYEGSFNNDSKELLTKLLATTNATTILPSSSRHSVDLGLATSSAYPYNILNSPKSRLSLDLVSSTSIQEQQSPNKVPMLKNHTSSNNNYWRTQPIRSHDHSDLYGLASQSTKLMPTALLLSGEIKSPSNIATGNWSRDNVEEQSSLSSTSTGTTGMIAISSLSNIPTTSNELLNRLHTMDTSRNHFSTDSGNSSYISNNSSTSQNSSNTNGITLPLIRVASLPTIHPSLSGSETISTPRRELAPPIEEDEEQDSESQRETPLRLIENNISALLRGDISVACVGENPLQRRPMGFRPGVHKSESAKEMLLSQNNFGPLPPSPPSSCAEDNDDFPPLPPSPQPHTPNKCDEIDMRIQGVRFSSQPFVSGRRHKQNRADIEDFRNIVSSERNLGQPPDIPPHRDSSMNTFSSLKTRSMDAGFSKSNRSKKSHVTTSSHGFCSSNPHDLAMIKDNNTIKTGCATNARRRMASGAYPKQSAQNPREEGRLQTSCSLPETPIFARGCDVPRTPHRRAAELPCTGTRTTPRASGTISSVIEIANTTTGNRQRNINHALASGEMLRLAGGPARGWYPKQRHSRPVSTEHLDRLHMPRTSANARAWDSGTGSRKPLTLPPNLTPKFFSKSPREALRRVTSLLIRKGNSNGKENDIKYKETEMSNLMHRSLGFSVNENHISQHSHNYSNKISGNEHMAMPVNAQPKKKGFFKSFWKKSKHYSFE